MLMYRYFLCLIIATSLISGCSSDDAAKKKTTTAKKIAKPKSTEERNEKGQIVRFYDHNGDGKPDVIKTLEEYPDPEDPATTLIRTREMKIDVNSDGQINIIRVYNDAGKLLHETSDINLDGKFDLKAYYEKGILTKKETLDPQSGAVLDHRYYASGNLLRIEKDTSNDNKIDYWEYYEGGTLDRIGRDFNGDGRADSWQKR